MHRSALIVAVGLSGSLLLPAFALADNTACTGAIVVVPDGSQQTGTFAATGEYRWFQFGARADRSYAVMVENLSPKDVAHLVTSYVPISDCAGTVIAGTTTPRNTMEPIAYHAAGAAGSGRWGLTSTATQTIFFYLSGTSGGQFRARVEETTQINTFFSTYSGFNTFYRFTNTTNESLTVTLKLVSDTGQTVAYSTFTIAANSSAPTRNTSASDLDVPPSTAGFAVITHNSLPNALAADGFMSNGTSVLPLKIVDARQRR